jgi:hypothetical protein
MTRRKNDSGQSIIFLAVALLVLLGFVGLAIDVGYLRVMKRKMQNAADATAIAAGAEILYSDYVAAAKAASASNGFTDTVNGVTVTVNKPPASGPHAGNTNYVEAIISQNQPTYFMKAFGFNSVAMTARSVAFGSSPNCIYALGTSSVSNDTLVLSGFNFVTSSCGVIGNANLGGFGLSWLFAPSIALVGRNDGFIVFTNTSPQTGIPVSPDPFASLPAPTVDTCLAHPTQTVISSGTVTLDPGTYCGGILVIGGQADFNPGIYVMNGGGFTVTAGGVNSVGVGGVTIYNTGTVAGVCTTCYGPINVSFSGGSSLLAPTTGTYAGILLFQDRLNDQAATFAANWTFGSKPFLTGAYYLPAAQANFYFDFGDQADYTILVAKKVVWLFTFTLNANYSTLPGGSPVKNTGVLVE